MAILGGPRNRATQIHRSKVLRISIQHQSTTKGFADPRLYAVCVDRLTFGGNIIEIGTDSYRLAHTKNKQATAG